MDNIKEEILKEKKRLGATIVAHYYQEAEIQDLADHVGDSLALAQYCEKTNWRHQTVLPEIGTEIYVPEEHLDLYEKLFPASVATHDKVGQKTVTTIP